MPARGLGFREDLASLGRHTVIGVCFTVVLTACSDDGPAANDTGSVEVTTVSTGAGLDQDGYVVEIVGVGFLAIGINATATLPEVPAAAVEIRLTDVRGNCTVQAPHPRLLRVAAGETFRTRFEVACMHTPLLGRIVFSSSRDGNSELYTMNPDGTDQVRLTNTPDEQEHYASISPDGSRILFANRLGGPFDDFAELEVYVMNADGTGRVDLTHSPGFDVYPAWSPDGSRIAFSRFFDESGYDIWVINADGTGVWNVTNSPTVGDFVPVWSPDGTRILFTAQPEAGDSSRLEVINADGTGRMSLTHGSVFAALGTWSPDGSRIAFVLYDNGGRLHTLGADGSGLVPLTPEGSATDDLASWSPTGDRLVFRSAASGDNELYMINADGTGLTNISNNPAFENLGPQAWGP